MKERGGLHIGILSNGKVKEDFPEEVMIKLISQVGVSKARRTAVKGHVVNISDLYSLRLIWCLSHSAVPS